MIKIRKAFLTLTILILCISLLSGCSSPKEEKTTSTQQQEKPTLRIANVIFPGGPPQGLIMINKGILKEKLGDSYQIKSILTRNIDRVSQEMKNEEYDFIFAYYGTIAEYACKLSEWESGNNFVVIANISNGPGNRLVAQRNIKDIKELDDKTVGVFNHDYAGYTLMANTLKENGVDLVERGGTVKAKLANSVEIINDFKSGRIDALMARPSFREPGYTTLKEPNEMAYGGAPPYQVLMVRKAFLEEHPGIVEKLLDAHIDTTEWIKYNRQETAEIVWAESEKFYKENQMQQLLPTKKAMENAYKKMLVNIYPNLQFINDTWGYMEKYNSVKPYPMDEVIDFTLLDKVLKEKGMPSIEEYNKTEYNK